MGLLDVLKRLQEARYIHSPDESLPLPPSANLGTLRTPPFVSDDTMDASDPRQPQPGPDLSMDAGPMAWDKPRQVAPEARRTGTSTFGKVLGGLGGAIRGGIDAAATPNIAFGGPTDIFRGLQAANQGAQEREALKYNRARQGRVDTMNEGRYGAESRKWDADALEQAAHARSLDALAAKRNFTHEDDVEVPGDWAKENAPFVLPDEKGLYWIPKTILGTLAKTPAERDAKTYEAALTKDWQNETDPVKRAAIEAKIKALPHNSPHPAAARAPHFATDEAGNMTAVQQKEDGTFSTTPIGNVGRQSKWNVYPPGETQRKATPGQFNSLNRDKNKAFADLEKSLKKRLSEEMLSDADSPRQSAGEDPAAFQARKTAFDAHRKQVFEEHEQAKQQIQDNYLNGIATLNPDFDPSQASAHPAARRAVDSLNVHSSPADVRTAQTKDAATDQKQADQQAKQAVKDAPKQTVTLAQAVAAAKRNGQTVDQVKAALKAKGIDITP